MKKQQMPVVGAITVGALVIAYFIYDRTRPSCDTIFEQTATRVAAMSS